MLQLDPQTKLPLVRQLNNPADVTGYYVRAIVRNSLLKTIIATIDLTDDGEGRFTGTYLVPSTEGLYFDITTKVYTNAEYTVASETYGSESETYLGSLRWSLQYWNNGGGTDVNYKKIEDIFTKVLGKYEFLSKEDVASVVNEAKDVLRSSIRDIGTQVSNIEIPEVKIPEPKVVDLSGLQESIDSLVPLIGYVKNDTEIIIERENDIEDNINTVRSSLDYAKNDILTKQDEKTQHEIDLQAECDLYREQLMNIQQSVAGINENYPAIKEQKKEKPVDTMSLRVKQFMK